ncbi:Gfo/Idh/MocA family protein [Legionella sp. W05-934-2]|jgi:predicted dehydrogenase|uniref:Gfo/Idh/MocA family protein n=1 Tax=Legionella sp. W05-934-2 TaxID=1198649 RepID=UPI00346285B2
MIRCAVIGVGYLGRFHAQKYQLLDKTELVAVCDVNPTTAAAVGQELNVPYTVDYRTLFSKVDAVSIAATTKQHYQIAKSCLEQGIHVLLEKPMTETIEQATALISIAQHHQCVLQIGHMERFNAARLALDNHLDNPLFIESHRLAPYKPRGADVNVVLDLMIHDIDIIQSIVDSPITNIDAQGAPVLSPSIDIANARIRFANHCVANVTASRISYKSERKTRIFQANTYISIDFQNKKFAVFEKGTGEMFPGIPEIVRHESTFENGDALLEEIRSFLECIEHGKKPLVSGEEGRAALETADKITHFINQELLLRERTEHA